MLPSGTLGWYPFDSDASDLSGNGNNGTLLGSASVAGGVLVCGGTGDGVSLPAAVYNALAAAGKGTISFKCKLTTATPLVDAKTGIGGTQTGNSHYPYTDGAAYISLLRAAAERVNGIALSGSITRTNWHRVTITSDPTAGWIMYQNDTVVSSQTQGTFTATLLRIGTNSAGTIGLDGEIDDLLIVNRALTAEEIAVGVAGGWSSVARLPWQQRRKRRMSGVS